MERDEFTRMLDAEVKGRIKEKLETAHNMKAKGYDLADIIELTGLTAEQIAQA